MNIAKYEILIPYAGLILLIVIGAMLLYAYIIGFAFAMNQSIIDDCASIIFDEHSVGYNTEFMRKYCLKITWNGTQQQ